MVTTIDKTQDSTTAGRNQTGQFTKGNKASVGHGGRAKRNLFRFRSFFSDDDLFELATVLFERAKDGDMQAIALLMKYLLPSPNVLLKVDEQRERAEEREAILNPTRTLPSR